MSNESITIEIITKEREIFELKPNIWRNSSFLCDTVNFIVPLKCGIIPKEDTRIYLDQVSKSDLTAIKEWCLTKQALQINEKTGNKYKNNNFVKNYFKKWDQHLFSIMKAANYLDISSLLECCYTVIANKITGKSPEEIGQFFGVENDNTKEDYKEIEKEFGWIMDQPPNHVTK
uniref:Skp1-related protein n=1 Tax=Rhabditophanes sp. KR3021 TaxID=114890 RepID=A0AC35TJ20_9BILA